jgi:hypothetical protein
MYSNSWLVSLASESFLHGQMTAPAPVPVLAPLMSRHW